MAGAPARRARDDRPGRTVVGPLRDRPRPAARPRAARATRRALHVLRPRRHSRGAPGGDRGARGRRARGGPSRPSPLRAGRDLAAQQEEELDRGSEAIRRCTGSAPLGYRAPCWQITAHTFVLLCERGFVYDSSLMGDDRPLLRACRRARAAGAAGALGARRRADFGALPGAPGPLRDPRQVLDLWWLEVESAVAERRGTSFCFHPEVIGRAWAFTPFEHFVRRLAEDPRVRLERCVDVAHELGEVGA